ncbi:MAG: hypothetical protein WB816_04205 [Methylocystis sp.]
MSEETAPSAPPAAEPQRAAAAPPKHVAPSLLAALVAPVKKFWPRETDLGRIGMVIAAPVLCWVFYTTSSGMVDIMQKEAGDWIGLAGAVIATTAILVMLASTSWSLGADLASLIAMRRMARERVIIKTAITALVFAFVFSISAFFSFTYYYNNIFKLSSKKIVGELQPMELAADVVLPTAKQVAARYDENTTQLETTPGFKAYLEQLEALSETARTADASLRESIRKSQDARQRVVAEAARRAAADLAEAQAASRQLDETKARMRELEHAAADLDAIIKAKQDEIPALETTAKQEEQAAVDASKGLDGLGASCGPNCLSHRAKSTEAQKRMATIRETLKGPITERANALRHRDALAADAIALKLKADSGAEARARPLPKGETAPDLGAMLQQLGALRDELRADPSWRAVREAKPLCEAILIAARGANAVPSALSGDFACEPIGAQARDRLTARDDMSAARAVFDKKCSLEGQLRDEIGAVANHIREASATDPKAAAAGFNEAKTLVDACVVSGKPAGLTETDVRGLLKRSDDFLRAHSTERNKFELAREAFWSFTPDATMAICVAMAQDAFVFIMKFLSEIFKRGMETRERRQFTPPLDLTDDEADPVETRAMKAVMRAAKPLHGDMSEIEPEAATFALLPLNVRENLTALLNRLVRDEIAHVDRKGHYVVDNVTISQVEQRLHGAMRMRWSRGPRGSDAGADGPKTYYGDAFEPVRRRRPSALERYLTHIPETGEIAAAPADRPR